jgi:hypothetical protein
MFEGADINTIILRYVIGVCGSIAVEATAFLRTIAANNRRIPEGYYTRAYVIGRSVFALIVAGPFAAFLAEKNAWTAFYIGITAPLIYDRVAAGIQVNDIVASPTPSPPKTGETAT